MSESSKHKDPRYDKYFAMGYSPFQIQEILEGLDKGLDISIYLNKEYSFEQMEQLRLGLEEHKDATYYAYPELSVERMCEKRLSLKPIDPEAKSKEKHDEMIKMMRSVLMGAGIIFIIAVFIGILFMFRDRVVLSVQDLSLELTQEEITLDFHQQFHASDYIESYTKGNLHLVPKLKYRFNELNQSYIQLTNQQTMLLDFLQEQPTAVINGLAGTGKTVIAVEKAKRLAEQGESVLFLCYNAFLRDVLKANNVIPGVVFHNIHSLAYEIMGQSDSPIDEVVNEFEDYLEIVFDSNSWKYKNIIVDEGQDLDDRLLQRLYELVKQKQGCFYVFYDKNQFVNPNELPQWIDNAECRLVLSKNCRNTVEVCKTSCGLIGLSKDQFNDVHGDTPKIKFYKTVEELESIVDSFISAMTKEDIPAEDISVLTVKSVEK
ncbi:MAG: AAA family ATPase [Solobacterium sp.]|nr:AAA family ATPase [Solobacterium sp.]